MVIIINKINLMFKIQKMDKIKKSKNKISHNIKYLNNYINHKLQIMI